MNEKSDEWVVIATTYQIEEAIAWRELLSGTGIEVKLSPVSSFAEMYPSMVFTDPHKLSVLRSQEVEARDQLHDLQNVDVYEDD